MAATTKGQLLFIVGLALLLLSWICERAVVEHYRSYLDEEGHALDRQTSDFLLLNARLLFERMEWIRIEMRVDDLEREVHGNPSMARRKDIMNLLADLNRDNKALARSAQEKVESWDAGLRAILPKIVPNKADEFATRWNEIVQSKSPGESLADALRGHLADRSDLWWRNVVEEFGREEADARRRLAQFQYGFKILYVLGSILVIVGEIMRSEGRMLGGTSSPPAQ